MIEMLRNMFATHGLPESLVTDNGSVFTSEEFGQFVQLNGVKHIKSAPYHSVSNGLAERTVQTFKEGLKKQSTGSIQARVSRFLFAYRITPHSSTGQSPAQLLLGRRPRSHLDVMHPQVDKRVHESQERQKANHDRCAKARTFMAGDKVYARNLTSGPAWLEGTVVSSCGPLSYLVDLSDGRTICRHIDHLRTRTAADSSGVDIPGQDEDDELLSIPSGEIVTTDEPDTDTAPEQPIAPRRSSRERHPPDRYMQPCA